MLNLGVGLRVWSYSGTVIVRRAQHTVNTSHKARLDKVVSKLISSVDVRQIPKDKHEALTQMTRNYMDINPQSRKLMIETTKGDEIMRILEKDDTHVVDAVKKHIKDKILNHEDTRIVDRRYQVPRLDPPINRYAVFLKYIHAPVPDHALIQRFYHYLPTPAPLYMRPAHFEKFIKVSLKMRDVEFFVQVLSDMKESHMDTTFKEKSKMIGNVLEIGHSEPLEIYQFLRSKLSFDRIILFNSVLKYCKSGDSLFMEVLKDIAVSKCQPNAVTYTYIMRQCDDPDNLDDLLDLMEKLVEPAADVYWNISMINNLLDLSSKLGNNESFDILLKWLVDMSALKTSSDSALETADYTSENLELVEYFKRQICDGNTLAYLPNFDEGTADACIKAIFRDSETSDKEVGSSILGILELADSFDVSVWEKTYKFLFRSLDESGAGKYTLDDLRGMLKFFLHHCNDKLIFVISNREFRTLLFDLFIRNAPDEKFAEAVQTMDRNASELFEQFYQKFPQGFDSSTNRKFGSSRLHKVITSSIVTELQKLAGL